MAGCGKGAGVPAGMVQFDIEYGPRVPQALGRGDPVRVAGVDVGRVRKVTRRPAQVLVQVRVRTRPAYAEGGHDWSVHRDARALIRARIFVEGDYFVDLSPGSPGAPRLRNGARISGAKLRPEPGLLP